MGLPSATVSVGSSRPRGGHVREFLMCAPAFSAQAPACLVPLGASYAAPCEIWTGPASSQCVRSAGTGSNERSQGQEQLCNASGLDLPGPAAALPAWLTPGLHRVLEQQASPAWDPGLYPCLQVPGLGGECRASVAGGAACGAQPDGTTDDEDSSLLVGYQDDWLEVEPQALALSEQAPFQLAAAPRAATFYVLCPNALQDEARLFLQRPHAGQSVMQEVTCMYHGLSLGSHAAAHGPADGIFPYDAAADTDGGLPINGSEQGAGGLWMHSMRGACKLLRQSLLEARATRPARHTMDDPDDNFVVVYIVCPSSPPSAPVSALLECTRFLYGCSAAVCPPAPAAQPTGGGGGELGHSAGALAEGGSMGQLVPAARDAVQDRPSMPRAPYSRLSGDNSRAHASLVATAERKTAMQVLTGDLLGDISGEAARAVALTVYQKLNSMAAGSQGLPAFAVKPLPASGLILAGSARHAEAANQCSTSGQAASAAPGTPSAGGEVLHCCYACLPPGCMPSSKGAQALLATAWTDQHGALLVTRLLPCAWPTGDGGPTPVSAVGTAGASEGIREAIYSALHQIIEDLPATTARGGFQSLVVCRLGAACEAERAAWAKAVCLPAGLQSIVVLELADTALRHTFDLTGDARRSRIATACTLLVDLSGRGTAEEASAQETDQRALAQAVASLQGLAALNTAAAAVSLSQQSSYRPAFVTGRLGPHPARGGAAVESWLPGHCAAAHRLLALAAAARDMEVLT